MFEILRRFWPDCTNLGILYQKLEINDVPEPKMTIVRKFILVNCAVRSLNAKISLAKSTRKQMIKNIVDVSKCRAGPYLARFESK